jgi:hypothetical protein
LILRFDISIYAYCINRLSWNSKNMAGLYLHKTNPSREREEEKVLMLVDTCLENVRFIRETLETC